MAITPVIGNPIRVTGTTDTESVIYHPREGVFIRRIYWFNPTTAGDLLTLKTANGQYIAELRAEADAGTVTLEMGDYFDNIYCTDMDSGTLYIYIR